MAEIVECVPNFSEGREKSVIESIVDEARKIKGVKLLDYHPDADHNRTVVTFIGNPKDVENAAFNMTKMASKLIDMSVHHGAHPRMGAMDVVPFIPVLGITMDECIKMAKRTAKRIGDELGIPVYLYEEAASIPERKNLAYIRKGQYEGFFDKIKYDEWRPDFGPQSMNVKSGATAVGARVPLVAFNVNLNTSDIEIAKAIARKVRFIGGGLRYVKAMGLRLEERNIVQVSMNLVNYKGTSIYQAFEMVKMEAKRYGVSAIGSEIIGLVPMEALIDCAQYYLKVEDFTMNQVLEKRMLE